MLLAPDAEPDDGLFDVVLIGDINKRDFVDDGAEDLQGHLLAHPKVELLRARRVAVDAPEPLPIELDGEQVGTTPGALRDRPRRAARACPGLALGGGPCGRVRRARRPRRDGRAAPASTSGRSTT